MVSFDRERVEEQAVDLLTELSLTDYEARTYVGLLRLGKGSAREVSEVVEVPRSRVYDAVESLHDMGLVDIRYGTPKQFIPVSQETTIRKFSVRYEDLIEDLSSVVERLTPIEMRSEQIGVWTTTGADNITRRLVEFVDDAESEVVLMHDEALLTDELLGALVDAEERGVDVYVAGDEGSTTSLEHVERDTESADIDKLERVLSKSIVVETVWEWSDTDVTRLLLINDEVTLVSVERHTESGEPIEVAIWGRGTTNNLVVVLRTIFDVQFGVDRAEFDEDRAVDGDGPE